MTACARCNTPLRVSLYARVRGVATALRCGRCGAVSSHLDGNVSPISPRMHPMGKGVKLSPWMLPGARPLDVGVYECRFRDVEGVLPLWWNGRNFQPSEVDTRTVQMLTFISWRGMWE